MPFGLDFTSKFASLQTKETLKIIFFSFVVTSREVKWLALFLYWGIGEQEDLGPTFFPRSDSPRNYLRVS